MAELEVSGEGGDTGCGPTFELWSHSEAETAAVAKALASALVAGDVVALEGPVGAGKTVFVRGVCQALGVPREAGVSSPTFALVHVYAGGRLPVAHLDLYRLGGEDELEALGFRDLVAGERLVVVEWAELVAAVGEVATFRLVFEDRAPETRRILLTCPEDLGAAARQPLAALARVMAPRSTDHHRTGARRPR